MWAYSIWLLLVWNYMCIPNIDFLVWFSQQYFLTVQSSHKKKDYLYWICCSAAHEKGQQPLKIFNTIFIPCEKGAHFYHNQRTHPEEPVLLHTPSRGRLSAKLSVFREPEEEEESEKEADEKEMTCAQQRETFLKWTCEAPCAPNHHSKSSPLPWQETCRLYYYFSPAIKLWSQNILGRAIFFQISFFLQ